LSFQHGFRPVREASLDPVRTRRPSSSATPAVTAPAPRPSSSPAAARRRR